MTVAIDYLAVAQCTVMALASDFNGKWLKVTPGYWVWQLTNFPVDGKYSPSDFMAANDGWMSLLAAVHRSRSRKKEQRSAMKKSEMKRRKGWRSFDGGESFTTRGPASKWTGKNGRGQWKLLLSDLWPQLTQCRCWVWSVECWIEFTAAVSEECKSPIGNWYERRLLVVHALMVAYDWLHVNVSVSEWLAIWLRSGFLSALFMAATGGIKGKMLYSFCEKKAKDARKGARSRASVSSNKSNKSNKSKDFTSEI